jgi:hypothetical protein
MEIGIDILQVKRIQIKIYDLDRTICDVLRYEKKLGKEIFGIPIERYVKDSKKNEVQIIALHREKKRKTYPLHLVLYHSSNV